MANVKITQLPSATTPLTGTEVFPLVQGTTTKQVTITGLFTSPVMSNPTLGVVGQADLINATGLPISSGVAGLGAGIATFLGTPSSANLRTAVTDETGTGALVFANAPVLVAPDLGTPTFLVATNATGTAVGLTAGSAITNANLTGAVTSVGNATSLGSFTSAQLRTALTDETGAGSAVFATSPTITAPILNQINDTNNAQILGLSPTTSAVDYLVVKNGIGVGVPLHFYADGSSANIGLHIQPKGTGLVTISDGTDFNKGIRFRSSSSAASAITLLDAVSTAGRVVTLPDATTTLVGRDTTDTLTNKTIAFSSNTFSGTLAIANGGTNASTAALAIENLLPAYAGNGSKGLRLNSGATALEWVADGGGTVTSVGGTGTVNGITLTGTVTTSGNLTLGGTLSGVSLTTQVTGILPTANGGTNLSSFTSGGVVYASSTSALATGSGLQFDGTNLGVGGGAFSRFSTATSLIGNNGYANAFRMYDDSSASTSQSSNSYGFGFINNNALSYTAGSSGSHIWFNANTEGMRLTSTGLGIGTSSPAEKLTVSGRINFSSYSTDADIFGFYAVSGVGTVISAASTNSIVFRNNASEKMRLDSAGNLGLGVTPSAWSSSYKAFEGNYGGALSFYASGSFPSTWLSSNAYYNGTNWISKVTDQSCLYQQEGTTGKHIWSVVGSDTTAGNTISFTQAMTLDASGNLGIGTSSPATKLDVNAGTTGRFRFTESSGTLIDHINGAASAFAASYQRAASYGWGIGSALPPTAMTLDSAGNLGLGVTPSAWNTFPAFQLTSNYALSALGYSNNMYYQTGYKYIATDLASRYEQASGQHRWFNAPSGTAGDPISFTQAMTLAAAGDLGVGITSPTGRLAVGGANTTYDTNVFGQVLVQSTTAYNATPRAGIIFSVKYSSGGSYGVGSSIQGYKENSTDGDFSQGILFTTQQNGLAPAVRASIDSSGNFTVGATSGSWATDSGNQVSPSFQQINKYNGVNGDQFIAFSRNSSTIGSITQSGTTAVLFNVTSDQRLKENIQDADSASSLIDSLQVRKFDWKTDQTHQRYGFIAQELVTVAPEAVHQPADIDEMMAVDYSKLVPMLVKEIQSLRQRLSAANL